MEWTYDNISRARDTVGALLARLELGTYRYDVEPADEHWRVHVEYATRDGWTERTLGVDAASLSAAHADSSAGDRLLAEWRKAMASGRAPGTA